MGARVLFRDSQGRDDQVQLSSGEPCFVGRSLDCAIRTDDAMVSRKHSRIWMESGRFFVEDLNSSNGTHVNNERVVGKRMLQHNDVVRCGSLWLRYVEDSPLGGPQPQSQAPAVAQQPRKPGTMRLDRNEGAVGQQPQQPQQPQQRPPQRPPQQPQQQPQQQAQQPQRPPQPAQQPQRPPQPAHQPQAQAQAPQQGAYGGPPPMPGAGGGGGASGAPAMPVESSVVVDLGDSEEITKLKARVKSLQDRADKLQSAHEREVADGKRMRAESSTLKERIEEMRDTIKDRDEQVQAHGRVAEELREELSAAKEELRATRDELGGMGDEVQARERKLARAEDDIAKLKEELDDRNRKLGEISKTKDEGWKKLNEQLAEIDHLREVINEQERMLEERRVGLVSQEQVIKELRAARERSIKEIAHLKAQRDQLMSNDSRRDAQIAAIDEENKRLSRMLAEAQASAAGEAGGVAASEHTMKINAELKELRVELRKLQSDNEHMREQLDRAELEADTQKHKVAQLEVELRDAQDAKATAESAKSVAEEAMTKAEVARHKAAEEALEAAKERDAVKTSGDDARRELDKLKRKLEEAEAKGGDGAAPAEPDAKLATELETARRKLRLALDRTAELERSMKTLEAELHAARSDAKQSELTDFEAEDTDPGMANPATEQLSSLAAEVYEGINDILSEIRNNLMLVHGEFSVLAKEQDSDSIRIISDTLDTLIGNAEDAKGTARRLREFVEFGG